MNLSTNNGALYVGVETIRPSAPGAGNTLAYTVIAGTVLKLISVSCLYTCSAAVGNRNMRVQVTDSVANGGFQLQRLFCVTAMVASSTNRLWLAENLGVGNALTQTASGGFIAETNYIVGGVPLIYLYGRDGGNGSDRLIIEPLGILAADTLTEIVIQAHVWRRAA